MRNWQTATVLFGLAMFLPWWGYAAPATPPVVSIVQNADPAVAVPQALELIGGLKGIVKDGDIVVIKPNLVTPAKPKEPGLMTDVRVVTALIKCIQKTAKCRIIIAEGSAAGYTPEDQTTTMDAFKGNGYEPLVGQFGVQLKDLNTDERVKVKLAGALGYDEYDLPKTITTCNVLIDVPVLKTHLLTGVTLGMKNLFGLAPLPKNVLHPKLDGLLCDYIRIRKPDLVLADGLICTEGQGPLQGRPIRRDLILAGREVVAVDAVCTAVMGYEPRRIKHLALAAKNGLGEIDLAKIVVTGKTIDEVKHPFAFATWEGCVSIARTDELAKRVLALADKTEDIRYGEKTGKTAYFNPERLKPNTIKYPLRTSRGFQITLWEGGKTMEFSAAYETVYEENCQAAIEELKAWIKANLGVTEFVSAGPRPSYVK